MYPNEQPPEPQEESATDKVLKDLQVNLPGQNFPMLLRIIIFFTLIGGLSIFGSLFADIVRPNSEDLAFYIVRILVGIGALATAYTLTEKNRLGIWIYGLIAFFALFSNPFIALIPWAVVIYLYTQRNLFTPSYPDFILSKLTDKIKIFINNHKP